MALNKGTLKDQIESAFKAQTSKAEGQGDAIADLADKLASAIDAYIKSGDVTTTVTGGSATGGAVTGSGTGSIS